MDERTKNILIAVDGSKNSKRALSEARRYADMAGAEIMILTVLENNFDFSMGLSKDSKAKEKEEQKKVGEAILKEALEFFEDFDGDVHTSIRFGYPASEVLKEAEENKINLIIMGSRGLGAFSRTFLGSVSNKVLNYSDSDVLIVR
ncbi:MAG: universal stress protein [Lactococcus lactis]|nr:universal stress protein [Lactococcus lactis]MDN6195266.1 universal stress protein [Atopostipes suicloacalis]MDN6731568.1 universal stress protein [Atopostipes suicloacalis]